MNDELAEIRISHLEQRIDRLVQDAQALGIETKPQEEIESLLRSMK